LIRKIDADLLEWKYAENKKTIMLRGARHVGKSSAVRALGGKFGAIIAANRFGTSAPNNALHTSVVFLPQVKGAFVNFYSLQMSTVLLPDSCSLMERVIWISVNLKFFMLQN